ncbi:MAG: hypothetical protein MI757_12905, partial [Pirellulales bacterium]|nr:hypothetical protein [Pirellulales bacterium]
DGHPGDDDKVGTKSFCKVNNGSTFLAYADFEKQIGGFARDLIIDYARIAYSKGYIVPLTPDNLGFWPFPKKQAPETTRHFDELVGWHRDKIEETCDWTRSLLDSLPKQTQN